MLKRMVTEYTPAEVVFDFGQNKYELFGDYAYTTKQITIYMDMLKMHTYTLLWTIEHEAIHHALRYDDYHSEEEEDMIDAVLRTRMEELL